MQQTMQPKPTASEVEACQFSSWYSTFRNLRKTGGTTEKSTASAASSATTSVAAAATNSTISTNDTNDTEIANNASDGDETNSISRNSKPRHDRRHENTRSSPLLPPHTKGENDKPTEKKTRNNVTIESIVIRPLPTEFIEYLLSDGVRLPECANKVSSCMNDVDGADHDDGYDGFSDENGENEETNSDCSKRSNESDSSDESPPTYNFPILTTQIQTALTSLKGACMPKLNWSSPKDATWMNCGSLRCQTVGDVYLLLKSSEFVGFDLERAWDELEDGGNCCSENGDGDDADGGGEIDMGKMALDATSEGDEKTKPVGKGNLPRDFQHELVLRKWCNLHPSMEFRCFVYAHELVGISQRHPSKFYPHLQLPPFSSNDEPTPQIMHPLTNTIKSFFETYVQHQFANDRIHRYVLDLYIDSQQRVWILDFNVWGRRTDALLFEWSELMELGARVQQTCPLNGCNNTDIRNDRCTEVTGSCRNELDTVHPQREENEIEPTKPIPEMRVVTKDMKSMTYDPLSNFRGPTDVMDLFSNGQSNCLASNGGGDQEGMPSFEEFMKQCVKPSEL